MNDLALLGVGIHQVRDEFDQAETDGADSSRPRTRPNHLSLPLLVLRLAGQMRRNEWRVQAMSLQLPETEPQRMQGPRSPTLWRFSVLPECAVKWMPSSSSRLWAP